MTLPQRKHLRRLGTIFEHARAPIFYVTCCVRDRAAVLANDSIVEIPTAAWRDAAAVHGWIVGRYVVMPEHVHFFASPAGHQAKDLSRFIESWKRWTKRQIRGSAAPQFEWQREFFDHLMRSEESYEEKWEYARANPVRASMVTDPDEWPYQGQIQVLPWQ